MKNQYVGDVNDFRKYGLLRCLAGDDTIKITVAWMLTEDDRGPDGRFIDYLHDSDRWRGHDEQLFDALRDIVMKRQERKVSVVEAAGLIPDASYHSAILKSSVADRDAWFAALWLKTKGADLVFFDPDNGLEVKSVRRGRRNSEKYLYWSEVEQAAERGLSVLVYQHFPRVKRGPYVEQLAEELARRCGVAEVIALRTANVVFLLAARREHAAALAEGVGDVERRWAGQFAVTRHRPGHQQGGVDPVRSAIGASAAGTTGAAFITDDTTERTTALFKGIEVRIEAFDLVVPAR